MLYNLLFFIITILIVVSFHEWGHYLACRLFGVRVERFSVGFGKVLFKHIDKRGTEWVLSALPLGGYVKPLNEPQDGVSGKALSQSKAWERFLIFFAGPFFSLLLAVIIYFGINLYGQKEPIPYLAEPAPQSVAAQAGLHEGDLILEVDGREIQGWGQFSQLIAGPMSLGGTVELKVLHASGHSERVVLHFPTQSGALEKLDFQKLSGLSLRRPATEIQEVIPNAAGARAGLLAGDKLIAIEKLLPADRFNPNEFVRIVAEHPDKAMVLLIERQQDRLSIPVLPERTAEGKGRLGIHIQSTFPMREVHLGVLSSFEHAVTQAMSTIVQSVQSLSRIVTGQLSVQNLSGPVSIATYAGKTASYGLISFLNFVALITISIGVFNLIPIPALDGGQMLLAAVEMLIRKPLSVRLISALTLFGYAILLLLMVFTLTLDLQRIEF